MHQTPIFRLSELTVKCLNEDDRDFFSKIARPDSLYHNNIPLQYRNKFLIHKAIEYQKPWAVKILLEVGIDSFDEEGIPILHLYFDHLGNTKEDNEIFEIFVNHGYVDNVDYAQCTPALWTLLRMGNFYQFEYLAHAISMDIRDFFQKPLVLPKTLLFPKNTRQPFFHLCLDCNNTAISYLLDNYSFHDLGIANLIDYPTNLLDDPFEFDENWKYKDSDLMMAMCLDRYFSNTVCSKGSCQDDQNYEIFQKLLQMGYLNEITLSYNDYENDFYFLYLAHEHKNIQDVNKILDILKYFKNKSDIEILSLNYAFETLHEESIRVFLSDPDSTKLLHRPIEIRYRNLSYKKTLLSHPSVHQSTVIKSLYTCGNALTNLIFPAITTYTTNFHDTIFQNNEIIGKFETPLYATINTYYQEGYCISLHKIHSIIHDLIRTMLAAGEKFNPQYINIEDNLLCSQTKKIKEQNKKLRVCKYRGPGVKNWVSPIYEDLSHEHFYVPRLLEACRCSIRDQFYMKNPHTNLFKVIPQLPIPEIIRNYLLFNIKKQ